MDGNAGHEATVEALGPAFLVFGSISVISVPILLWRHPFVFLKDLREIALRRMVQISGNPGERVIGVAEEIEGGGPFFTFGDSNMRTRFTRGAREF